MSQESVQIASAAPSPAEARKPCEEGLLLLEMCCHRLWNRLGSLNALLELYRLYADGNPGIQRYNDRFDELLKRTREVLHRTEKHLRQPVLRCQRTDLLALVRQAFTQHSYPGRYQLDPELDDGFEMDVDPTFLGLAFEELIENASKHHPDPPKSLITIRIEHCQVTGCEGARITFADNGRGVPEEIRPRIFEPFFSNHVNKESGLGLGLFHVQRIIAAHGGSIRCEEALGGGASFVIELTCPVR